MVFLIVRGTGADAEGTIYVDETSFLSYNVDTDAPVVQSVEPPTIGEGILSNSIIGVTFDEPIDAGDSFSDIRLQSLSGTVVQATTRIHRNELFIAPIAYLQPGTEYKAILPQGAVKDRSGNGLQAAYEYSFKVKNGIEILNNGDFEQSFTYWHDSVSEGGTSGNQLLINGSSSGFIAQQIAATGLPQDGVSIVYQDVGVQAAKTYEWGGRVHIAELRDAKFQLYVDFLNASGNVVATRIQELTQATGGYVYVEDRLTAPDGAVTARFSLVLRALAQGGGGTVIADTLSFIGEKEPDIVVPVASLIVNGGFEEGDDNTLTGWSVFSSVNTSVGSSVYSPNAGYTEYISRAAQPRGTANMLSNYRLRAWITTSCIPCIRTLPCKPASLIPSAEACGRMNWRTPKGSCSLISSMRTATGLHSVLPT